VPEEKDIVTDTDPLRNAQTTCFSTDAKGAHDLTIVGEGDDIVDSKGHPFYPEVDAKPTPATPKRASHLRLDLKPPSSPQPWELVEPPNEEGRKGPSDFFTIRARKFHALHSTTYVVRVVQLKFVIGSMLLPRHSRPLIPKSSYYFGPPPSDAAFGTHPIGQIGLHHPREIIRIERDYTGGELIQFAAIYPLELEGRVGVALTTYPFLTTDAKR